MLGHEPDMHVVTWRDGPSRIWAIVRSVFLSYVRISGATGWRSSQRNNEKNLPGWSRRQVRAFSSVCNVIILRRMLPGCWVGEPARRVSWRWNWDITAVRNLARKTDTVGKRADTERAKESITVYSSIFTWHSWIPNDIIISSTRMTTVSMDALLFAAIVKTR